MGRPFRVLLLGTQGVGKTSYMNRLRTGEYPLPKRDSTERVREVTQLKFEMEHETIRFIVEEHFPMNLLVKKGKTRSLAIPSQGEAYEGETLLKGQFDAVIAMFDQSKLPTAAYAQGRAQYAMRGLSRARGTEVPLVYVGNKSDLTSLSKEGTALKKRLAIEGYYFDISVKDQFNLERPFIYLARRLSGKVVYDHTAIPKIQNQTREIVSLLSEVAYDEVLEEKLNSKEVKVTEMDPATTTGTKEMNREAKLEKSRQKLELSLIEFIAELQKKEDGQVNVRAEVMRTLRDMVSQASPL